MKKYPTKFARYYVSEDGNVWREDNNGELYKLKLHRRGGAAGVKGGSYMGVNISLYNDEGKFVKQIKYYVHRLVAETLIPNPENLPEVEHRNRLKEDNAIGNLEWITRAENMERIGSPEGTIRGYKNSSKYIKENGKWVLISNKNPPWNTLPDGTIRTRKRGTFLKVNGEWVLQKKTRAPKVYQRKEKTPDGTIKKRSNGYYYIKRDGEWRYLCKKEYTIYEIDR